MKILFLDTETTDLEQARIIQLAFKERPQIDGGDIENQLTGQDSQTGDVFMEYFKPPVPIDFMAMATHHITEKMVADKTPFNETEVYKKLPTMLAESILVAHNAKFDMSVLENEGVSAQEYVCTLKVAQNMYDYPNHKMQYLRYRWGIDIDNALAHDAKGDVLVLEKVFDKMILDYCQQHNATKDQALEKFIELTKNPVLLKTLNFGKHAGKTFSEIKKIDAGYLQWLGTLKDKGEDFEYTIQHHLG